MRMNQLFSNDNGSLRRNIKNIHDAMDSSSPFLFGFTYKYVANCQEERVSVVKILETNTFNDMDYGMIYTKCRETLD